MVKQESTQELLARKHSQGSLCQSKTLDNRVSSASGR